ncbi:MAG: hypothetical protein ACRCU9_11920, partial [Iodobacter sp.]
ESPLNFFQIGELKNGGEVAGWVLLEETVEEGSWSGYFAIMKTKYEVSDISNPNTVGQNSFKSNLINADRHFQSKKIKYFYKLKVQSEFMGGAGSPSFKYYPADYQTNPLYFQPDQAISQDLSVAVEAGATKKTLIPINPDFFKKTYNRKLWFKPTGDIASSLDAVKVIFSNGSHTDLNRSAATEVAVPNGVTTAHLEVTAKAGAAAADLGIDVSSLVDNSVAARRITVNVNQSERVQSVGSVTAFLGVEASLPVAFKSELPAGSKIYTNLDKTTNGKTDLFQFCPAGGACIAINAYGSATGTITLAAKASSGVVKIKPKAGFNVSPLKLYMSTRNALEDPAMPSGTITVANPPLEVADVTSTPVVEGEPLLVTIKLKNAVVIDQKIKLKFIPGTAVFDEINPAVAEGTGFNSFTLKNNEYVDVLIKSNTTSITFNIATKPGVAGNKDKQRSFKIAAKGDAGSEYSPDQTIKPKEYIASVANKDVLLGQLTTIPVTFNGVLAAGTVIYTNLDKAMTNQLDQYEFCPEGSSACVAIPQDGAGTGIVALSQAATKAEIKIKPKASFDLSINQVKVYISTLNYPEGDPAAAGMPSGTMTFITNPPLIEFTSSSPSKSSLFEPGSPPVELNYDIKLSNMPFKSARPLILKNKKAYLQQRMADAFSIKMVLTGADSVNVTGQQYCAFKKDALRIPVPLTAHYGQAKLPLDCSVNSSIDLGDPSAGGGSWQAQGPGVFAANIKLWFDLGAPVAQTDAAGQPWQGDAAVSGTLTLQVGVNP